MKPIADMESEHRVISGMLHSETACITSLNDLIDDDFNDPFARSTFQLIDSLYRQGVKPTAIEIRKESLKLGFVSDLITNDKLQQIITSYIYDGNIGYWIDKVKESSKGRKAQQLLVKYAKAMDDGKKDIDSLVTEMGSEFFSLSLESRSSMIDTGKDLAQLGRKLLQEKIKNYRENIETCRLLGTVPFDKDSVPTGLPDLDRLTLGYKPGDLIILAAQTGHGKTAFALNTANAICIQQGIHNIGYTNTEMSREQIAQRWGAILSGVSFHQIRAGSVTDAQAKEIYDSYTKLEESGFRAAHEPNLTPRRMKQIAQKMVMQDKIKLMILDYIGRMDVSNEKEEWQALRQIIKSQKIMAQNLKIANMVLVQLNPDGTLQGAKQMKNEADIMMRFELITDNEKVAKIQEYRKKKFEEFNSYIYLEKSRDSASGIYIPIVFEKDKQQMRQAKIIGDFAPADWSDLGKEVKR